VRDPSGAVTVRWQGSYKAAAYRQSRKYSFAKTGIKGQRSMVVPPGMSLEDAVRRLGEIQACAEKLGIA
jgi:hypothetical protein